MSDQKDKTSVAHSEVETISKDWTSVVHSETESTFKEKTSDVKPETESTCKEKTTDIKPEMESTCKEKTSDIKSETEKTLPACKGSPKATVESPPTDVKFGLGPRPLPTTMEATFWGFMFMALFIGILIGSIFPLTKPEFLSKWGTASTIKSGSPTRSTHEEWQSKQVHVIDSPFSATFTGYTVYPLTSVVSRSPNRFWNERPPMKNLTASTKEIPSWNSSTWYLQPYPIHYHPLRIRTMDGKWFVKMVDFRDVAVQVVSLPTDQGSILVLGRISEEDGIVRGWWPSVHDKPYKNDPMVYGFLGDSALEQLSLPNMNHPYSSTAFVGPNHWTRSVTPWVQFFVLRHSSFEQTSSIMQQDWNYLLKQSEQTVLDSFSFSIRNHFRHLPFPFAKVYIHGSARSYVDMDIFALVCLFQFILWLILFYSRNPRLICFFILMMMYWGVGSLWYLV